MCGVKAKVFEARLKSDGAHVGQQLQQQLEMWLASLPRDGTAIHHVVQSLAVTDNVEHLVCTVWYLAGK